MEPILDAASRAAVGEAMRRVADIEIRPRFRSLADGQIHLKGPGDYVTEADLEACAALGVTEVTTDHPARVVAALR